ncbi:MAG: TlpA family protein disulfide reductase [Haloferacaceae archaeon]
MKRRTRRAVLGAVGASAIGFGGCLGGGDGGGDAERGATDSPDDGSGTDEMSAWRTAELTDVTTDEQFRISELDAPVLVHPFAIWCSTCSRQNREIDALQRENGREVVQLNIGDSENGDDVLEYAEANGYADHSRFAVASSSVASALVEDFGPAAVSPPQSPVILVCSDGNAHEIGKVAGPETIESEIETNCG